MIRLGFTLLVGLPFILISMPTRIKISGLLVLMIFTTFFGSAVSIVRRRTEGHYNKLKLLPIPMWSILSDMVLANGLIDFFQMGILLALFSLVNFNGITLIAALSISGLFIINIFILNIWGILLGHFVRNNSEVHLFGALGVGILAFLSGLFPVHSSLKNIIEIVSSWNTVSILRNNIMGLATESYYCNVPSTIISTLVLIAFLLILFMRILDR
jgi:hypothetical protein